MNGKLHLPMARGRYYTVYGGPYKKRPESLNGFPTYGVKMADEIRLMSDVAIDVVDFGIPTVQQVDDALLQVVNLILSGRPVYVGCMGGIGRTGLLLAILAKVWGIEEPVKYVRVNYMAHAVETAPQMAFVRDYEPPPEVIGRMNWAKVWSFFRWKRSLTLGVTATD